MADIEGDENDNTLNGTSGQDDISGNGGQDTIDGGGSGDTISGGSGNDSIDGGTGDDTIFGGDGNDTITGGGGDDVIVGGRGDDVLTAGNGSPTDTYVIRDGDGNDTITDFDPSEPDVIRFDMVEMSVVQDVLDRISTDGPDTIITYDNGSTIRLLNTDPLDLSGTNFEFGAGPVCYVPGTLILTDRGEVAVQELRVGDLLITADRAPQPIRRIAETRHSFPDGPHRHKPIEIKAGSLGDGRPRRHLIVSPQHRMVLSGPVVEEMFGTREVLALAKGLVGLDHIRAMNGKREVTYFSLLCDCHEIIMAEGAWSETFRPDANALRMITSTERSEVEALFPRLMADPDSYGPKARRTLTRKETEALVEALLERGFDREDNEIAKWKREADDRKWDDDLLRERSAQNGGRPNLRVVC